MAGVGGVIKWHGTTEYLQFDPEKLPRHGDVIDTWEQEAEGAPKYDYKAIVQSCEAVHGQVLLQLQYVREDQSPRTQRANKAWGLSTLSWSKGQPRGTATWRDGSDRSRNGTCMLTLHYGASTSSDLDKRGKYFCEIWTGARWELWPVVAAYPHRHSARLRCYECQGGIILMQESEGGRNRAHFEHRPAHAGCSLVYSPRRHLLPASAPTIEDPTDDTASPDYISDEAVSEIIGDVGATEKERLVLSRVGQGQFRERLMNRWERKCSVVGCGPQAVLVASHIVAWRACQTNKERLDVDNGLLLTPNLDKLFDRQLISFQDDGQLVVSLALDRNDARALGLRPDMRLANVPSGILKYLERHRGSTDWKRLGAS